MCFVKLPNKIITLVVNYFGLHLHLGQTLAEFRQRPFFFSVFTKITVEHNCYYQSSYPLKKFLRPSAIKLCNLLDPTAVAFFNACSMEANDNFRGTFMLHRDSFDKKALYNE